MSIHSYTGLSLKLAGQGRAFDMGNHVHRRAAALALQSVGGAGFSNELIDGLNDRPGTLTPELREEFHQITSTNPQFQPALVDAFESLLKREPAANGISFVPPQSSMVELLRACGIGPNDYLPYTSERTARAWGNFEGQSTKSFREPRSLKDAQAVALHIDKVAMGEGWRVDIAEFGGHINPEFRVMLEEATKVGNVVYVRPPVFMAHLPFKEHTFQKFASGLANSGLAKRMGQDVGVAIDRLQTYVSDKSGKIMPYVSTLKQISRAIAYDALASENGQYAREVFRYLMVLRMRDYLTVEEGGKLRSLVPIEDEGGLPAMTLTSKDVASRYTIIVKPDMRELHGSDEAAKHGRRWRWIDRIMSDQYEKRISEWKGRLASFDAFDSLIATRHNGRRLNLRRLRTQLAKYGRQHSAYKTLLEKAGGEHDAMTHEEIAECAQFYGKLERAFRQAMYFTHVRGEVARDGRSISYEIVSQPNARSAARIPSGFVPVYGGDVFAQDWNVSRQEALVAMRAVRGYLARTGQLPNSGARFAEEVLSFYWPARLLNDFNQALEDMRELGGQDLFNGRNDATLPVSQKQPQDVTGESEFYLYDAGYAHVVPRDGETKLQAVVRRFYDTAGWGAFADSDSSVIRKYLVAIRYPHYVYDQDLLANLIGRENPTGPAHTAARKRIEKLFGAHSIKNEEAYNREQAGQHKVTARTLTEQAFSDYRQFFSASVNHGLELPVEEDLVRQIAQGLVARHSSVNVDARRVVQGVYDAIGMYNRALRSDTRQLSKHSLLQRGLFDSRFDRFANAWQARADRRELPLDRRILISAAQSLMSMATGVEDVIPAVVQHEVEMIAGDATPERVVDAISFLTSWLKRQRRDVDLMSRMLKDGTYGVEAFLKGDGQRYRSPVIPASDIALLAARAIRRRLSMSGEMDGRTEALDVLNDRFEFLPQVRQQAATFMQAAAAHYLKWLRASLSGQLGTMVDALELMGDGGHPITDHNDFVRDLVGIADASVPLKIFHDAYPSLRAVERMHRVAAELSTGTMRSGIGLSDRVSSTVRRSHEKIRAEQKEIAKLKAVLRAKVERIQRAYDRGSAELASASRDVADLVVSRAAMVSTEIAGFGSRIPEGDHSNRSDSALRRIGRIAHAGAGWATRELNLNSGSNSSPNHISLVRFVRNLQSYVVGSDFSPWIDRLSTVDDRLIEQGLRFEETRDAVKAEQDRRARAEADSRASSAIMLATEEVSRLDRLITPETFDRRLNDLLDRLGGVESRYDDPQAYNAARNTLGTYRREARQVINFINSRLAVVVNGIELDHQPAQVISQVREAASQAHTLRERTNASAEDVLRAWDRVRAHAEDLSEARQRVYKALQTARDRMAVAERNLPAATDVDMTDVNRVVGRVRRMTERDNARVTLYMARSLSKKHTTQAIDSINGHTRSTAVLSVGDRGYLVLMDDANRRSFNVWRDGGRKGNLMLASINGRDVDVPEGSYPVYTTPISDLPESHPLGRMAAHLAALKNDRGPARSFVAWVDQQRRDGNLVAMQVWDHIIARLADPNLQTQDVQSAIADVAAAMRQDLQTIDPGLRWVDMVTDYEPVTRPMFADERRQLSLKNSLEIDANAILRVGGRRAVVHAMPSFMSAVEDTGIMPKDPTRLQLWRALLKGSKKRSSGPVPSGITSAAAVWVLIDRAERRGHPHAGALRDRLLSRLKGTLFPTGIMPNPSSAVVDGYANDIARASEEFYIELYAELEHPRLIHDASLGYGVARHESVGGSVAQAMGFADGTLASRLISTIFEYNCYLPSGYALWRAFGNDEGSRELCDAMRVVFRRYGGYRLDESEPLSIHWMLEEMQDVLTTVAQASSENRPLPAWWTTPADARLAARSPETAFVSWFRIDHTVRPSAGSDKLAAIHNASHRFVQLFPEFAGAVTIIETVRAAIGNKREYPFIQKITALYSRVGQQAKAGTLDDTRDAVAAEFRKHYLSKLPFLRAVLTKSFEGRQTLAEDLRIYDAIPSEIDDPADVGLASSPGMLRGGARANPTSRPSK